MHATGTGRLTRDAELRYLPNGSAVCGFGVAINDGYMKDGKWQELPTTFIDVEMFGKGAERIQGLSKGTEVYISGKVKSQQWEKDGQKRSKVLIQASEVRPLAKVERREAEPAKTWHDDANDDPAPF